jgi:Amt family ammonium transporter
MIYQLMFAIITPALITGAFAERMKFSAMAVFLSLWSLLVYSPMAHMVWGVGGLLNSTQLPRRHFPASISPAEPWSTSPAASRRWSPASTWASASATPTPTCRPTPWCSASSAPACSGWAGSASTPAARSAPALATSAFVNTHFAAAAAALGWTVAEWIHNGKPTALGAISGAVAGLVAITPASGFVQPLSALAIGLIAGVFCSFMVFIVKSRLGYDDSLDAFGVHGAGGTLGALLTGLFATSAINAGLRQGRRRQGPSPPAQSTATGARCSTSSPASALPGASPLWAPWCCFSSSISVIGLRVSPEDEAEGLDLSQHGEEGYDLNS